MKRGQRIAVLGAVLGLGIVAWLALMFLWQSEGELRLVRELSTGRLMARVPQLSNPLNRVISYGPPELAGKYTQPGSRVAGVLPKGTVYEGRTEGEEQIWYIRLDPLDKSWEIEVKESRSVYLETGGKAWRIGTKTRVWRTRRVAREGSESQ